ncbi:MAG: gliding motility-associated C-terminal domain-containing protein [Bacteroidota bacterium]|nr:gliding motility-associated C-terminal domain-containing protein [Bacteroidota bacterium]
MLGSGSFNWDYIGVINHPWKKGIDCNYDADAINVSPGQSHYGLPNLVMDYNLRFFFEGDCEGTPFTFQHNFLPVPDSIEWNFGDTLSGANNISNELNPTHVFSDGGEYEVSVDVWYPSGRFEHTSRMVQVTYAPWPDLGPDLEICYGEEVTLTANGGPGYHTWNTGSHDTSIIVSDTGWYWVKIKNTAQCSSTDSIYIGYSESPAIDSSNLVITPTGCGGSTGSIEGLQFLGNGPFSYLWTDDAGNPLDTTLNLYNLPVGNYTLFVTDTNTCQWPFGPFTIEDGGDINITQVIAINEHCDQQDGSIQISAHSAYTDQFIYSIDNGNNYFDNEGVFNNLSAGSYAIRVQDTAGCESAWSGNPVELINEQAPQVEDTLISPATDGQANGSITIDIVGTYDTLYYQIEGLTGWQLNDSAFTNLAAGFYKLNIQDKYGCQTSITVEVPEIFTIKLEAVAGEDEACPGNSAFVPLTVHNFEDVAEFQMTLYFNDSLLECTGFSNAHAQLESNLDVQLFPAGAKVQLHWSGEAKNLPDASVVADLVFTAESTGLSQVSWDGQEGTSWFKDAEGNLLPDSFQVGQVRVYNDLELTAFTQPACEGDEFVIILSNASGGNGNINYEWTSPSGDHQEGGMILLETASIEDAGLYTVTATDAVGCTATAETELIVNPLPQPGFAGQDTIPFSEHLQLDAGPGQQHYQWSTGDTTQSIHITQEGWYKVELTSPQGCTSIDSVYALNIYLKLYIPNAFSPNGDGMNDEFRVVLYSSYIPKFSMEIYNRWGQLIYQSKDPLQGWNGKVKGKDSPQGAYVYRIVYEYIGTGEQRTEELRTGSFVLVR